MAVGLYSCSWSCMQIGALVRETGPRKHRSQIPEEHGHRFVYIYIYVPACTHMCVEDLSFRGFEAPKQQAPPEPLCRGSARALKDPEAKRPERRV